MALIYLLVSDKTPTVVISAIRPTSIQRVWLTAAARPQVPRSHPCTGPKVSPNLGLLYSLFYTSTQMSLQSSFTCCRWLLDRLQVEKVSSSFQLTRVHWSGIRQVWVTALSKLRLKSTRAPFVLSIHYEGCPAGQQHLLLLLLPLLLRLPWTN